MNTKYEFLPGEANKIVYVRPVPLNELPEDIRQQAEGLDHLYAVCDAEGTQLALVRDRQMAFVLARQNDLAPVNVH